eukprot:TRINITY_DN1233_c0_g1_i10.p4 TRINITY_DN1233_c0_g1~~TRINITY_DN1233_c0_g1_i10.p4  ORF type:complete len:127 (+),score=12.65 TRINITY_DN1233_c0_g1_i10:156-536(+)
MIRRPPRSTHCISSAASDVYKRQVTGAHKPCRRKLFGRSQQRLGTDLTQVELGNILEQFNFRQHLFRLRRQDRFIGLPLELFLQRFAGITHRFGRYCAGSTGLPCLRISKCSLTDSASVLPISAIF